MTTPKRWYQLSMLQMLVAMAVVAFSMLANARVTQKSVSLPFVHDPHVMLLESGWPFAFRSGLGVVGEETANDVAATDSRFAGAPEVRPLALTANMACCGVLTAGLVSLVAIVSRKFKQ